MDDLLSTCAFAVLAALAVIFIAITALSARKEKRALNSKDGKYSVRYVSMLLYIFLLGLIVPLAITFFAAFYAKAMLEAALLFLTPFYIVYSVAFLNIALFNVDIDGDTIHIRRFLKKKRDIRFSDISCVKIKRDKEKREVKAVFLDKSAKKLFCVDTTYALNYARLHEELGARQIEVK